MVDIEAVVRGIQKQCDDFVLYRLRIGKHYVRYSTLGFPIGDKRHLDRMNIFYSSFPLSQGLEDIVRLDSGFTRVWSTTEEWFTAHEELDKDQTALLIDPAPYRTREENEWVETVEKKWEELQKIKNSMTEEEYEKAYNAWLERD